MCMITAIAIWCSKQVKYRSKGVVMNYVSRPNIVHTGIGVCCGKMQACCFLLIRVLKRSKAGFNVKTKQLWWRKLMNLHQWHMVVTSTWDSYICDWASENESLNFIKFWHKISTFFNFVTLNEQSVQVIDIFIPLMNGLISNILQ